MKSAPTCRVSVYVTMSVLTIDVSIYLVVETSQYSYIRLTPSAQKCDPEAKKTRIH